MTKKGFLYDVLTAVNFPTAEGAVEAGLTLEVDADELFSKGARS